MLKIATKHHQGNDHTNTLKVEMIMGSHMVPHKYLRDPPKAVEEAR